MFSKGKKARQATPAPAAAPPTAPAARDRDRNRLPKGAEAALWSIVESIPDPRNHLAMTRDPTAEVRLSRRDIDAATAAAPVPIPGPIPVPTPVPTPAPAIERPTPRHEGVRWSVDTAEVRLPALAGPHDLEGEGSGGASVHPIEPAPARVDPGRFAKPA